jgi:hypothetical protein
MSSAPRQAPLRLPTALDAQLHGFRRRVWAIKMAEAAGVAVFAVVVAFLCVFVLDRLRDTPPWLRFAVLAAAFAACSIVPLYLYFWIWRRRGPEQLARLLSRRLPHLGDQLLGIMELVRSETEQARSRALCEAAIRQVAHDAQQRDLREAAPQSRWRLWNWLAAAAIATVVGLAAFSPAAVGNAWVRFLVPWNHTPRYTFASLDPLPEHLVVPHGEPFQITARLAPDARWHPPQGHAQLDNQRPVQALLRDGRYGFELPAQITPGRLHVRIGDSRPVVQIEPMLRPELISIVAEAKLPEYLGRSQPVKADVRGGAVSLVTGSRASFVATASRTLSAAQVSGRAQTPVAATIRSPETNVDGVREIEFQWQDEFGLAGKQPFKIAITARDDEPPSLACEDLPRSKVVLDSEQLSFRVKAQDDFGVQRIGIEWQPVEGAVADKPAKGERILAAGGCDQTTIDVTGAFCAQALGIQPQAVQVRVFAEDYFPGRERVYAPACVWYVLNAEQHAVWMSEQLSKWHRQSLEVRDRELQLYETNKQLRDLAPAELDQLDTRRRIEDQAAAERANSRRLSNLVTTGEELLRQASRNPEFGVGHLERWAEMLQILKDISANRMPSVADLLQQAAKAPELATSQAGDAGPKVGQVRGSSSGAGSKSAPSEKTAQSAVPGIVDVESTQQLAKTKSQQRTPESPGSKPRLGLPTTTLLGGGTADPAACPAGRKMDEAARQQHDLLAEFEKIANELNNILANLEGSTLVKRLKAAAREQYRVGGALGDQLTGAFGLRRLQTATAQKKTFEELAAAEAKSSHNLSLIMDDMQAYFERRRFVRFKTVLEDMKKQDVIGGLRQLGDDLSEEQGLSIAQCEYWSDAMDRWAEDLVDPVRGGT